MAKGLQNIIHRFFDGKRKIRFAILSVFIGLSAASTLITSTYTYLQIEQVIRATSRDLIDKTQKAIINDIVDFLHPARYSPIIGAGMEKQEPNLLKENVFIQYLLSSLHEFHQIDAFYTGDEQGNSYIVGRVLGNKVYTFSKDKPLPPGCAYFLRVITRDKNVAGEKKYYLNTNNQIITSEENPSHLNIYDARVRPWYSNTKKTKKHFWTDIYLYETGDLGLTSAAPIIDDAGNVIAVIGADVTVNKISDLLAHQKVSRSGINFIVDESGSVVGYPDPDRIIIQNGGTSRVAQLEQLGEPALLKAYDLYKKEGERHIFFNHDGIDYIGHFTQFPKSSSNNWTLGMVVPADDFIGPIKKTNFDVMIISTMILLIACILLMIFSHKISYPIEVLADQMRKISRLDIDDDAAFDSGLHEISQMNDALHAMKEGLSSFSKFVPKSLVQRLIQSGQVAHLGGERKRLTILFSDVEGFTSIAEKTNSNDLLRQFSDYLNALSTLILTHHGTIDKYIGDAIMAFWGAPDKDDNQVYHGCHTMLLCLRRLEVLNEAWAKAGKPIFKTRFGLHTGDALVGNVGSSDRMNYTLIGDSVNLASRLEGANKNYGTYALVSESVHEKVKDKFLFRPLDIVAVKGKEKGIKIYELMAKKTDDPDLAPRPHQEHQAIQTRLGFDAYLKRDWDGARQIFETLKTTHPDDFVASLYIDRCILYAQTPPPDDWDGVFHLKTK